MENKINKINEYFLGIDKYNDALVVRVRFPKGWVTFPSEDQHIKVTPSEDSQGEWFYYGNSNECTLNDIFDLIEATISSNKDMILKLELLKEKIQELKEEFSKRDYKELVNMTFKFTKPRKAKKTKANEITEPIQDTQQEEVDKTQSSIDEPILDEEDNQTTNYEEINEQTVD